MRPRTPSIAESRWSGEVESPEWKHHRVVWTNLVMVPTALGQRGSAPAPSIQGVLTMRHALIHSSYMLLVVVTSAILSVTPEITYADDTNEQICQLFYDVFKKGFSYGKIYGEDKCIKEGSSEIIDEIFKDIKENRCSYGTCKVDIETISKAVAYSTVVLSVGCIAGTQKSSPDEYPFFKRFFCSKPFTAEEFSPSERHGTVGERRRQSPPPGHKDQLEQSIQQGIQETLEQRKDRIEQKIRETLEQRKRPERPLSDEARLRPEAPKPEVAESLRPSASGSTLPGDQQAEMAAGQKEVRHMLTSALSEGGLHNEEAILAAKRRLEALNLQGRAGPRARQQARGANERGLQYVQAGQWAEAVQAFSAASQAAPTDVEITNNLGYAYLRQGDVRAAEQWLLRTLVLAPGRTNAWANLGQTYAQQGDLRAAVACFANAYRFSRNQSTTRQFLQNLAEDEGNADKVREAARQALQLPLVQAGQGLMEAETSGRKADPIQGSNAGGRTVQPEVPSLAVVAPSGQQVQTLIQELKNPDSKVRERAAAELARRGPQAMDAWSSALAKEDSQVQQRAAEAFTKIKDPSIVDRLIVTLKDKKQDLSTRTSSAMLLGLIKDRRAINPLREITMADNEDQLLRDLVSDLLKNVF